MMKKSPLEEKHKMPDKKPLTYDDDNDEKKTLGQKKTHI